MSFIENLLKNNTQIWKKVLTYTQTRAIIIIREREMAGTRKPNKAGKPYKIKEILMLLITYGN
jgi:hypothetical protein